MARRRVDRPSAWHAHEVRRLVGWEFDWALERRASRINTARPERCRCRRCMRLPERGCISMSMSAGAEVPPVKAAGGFGREWESLWRLLCQRRVCTGGRDTRRLRLTPPPPECPVYQQSTPCLCRCQIANNMHFCRCKERARRATCGRPVRKDRPLLFW